MLDLKKFKVLVLNGDGNCWSYSPLKIINAQIAISQLYAEAISVLETYDQEAHSEKITIKIPSVIMLKEYIYVDSKVNFSRRNLFYRDNFTCQYCGKSVLFGEGKDKLKISQLEVEHIYPASRGGTRSFLNCTTSCCYCNKKKGNKTPHEAKMPLLKDPYTPSFQEMYFLGKKYLKTTGLPEKWIPYLNLDDGNNYFYENCEDIED